jgi:hypothetical protein
LRISDSETTLQSRDKGVFDNGKADLFVASREIWTIKRVRTISCESIDLCIESVWSLCRGCGFCEEELMSKSRNTQQALLLIVQ